MGEDKVNKVKGYRVIQGGDESHHIDVRSGRFRGTPTAELPQDWYETREVSGGALIAKSGGVRTPALLSRSGGLQISQSYGLQIDSELSVLREAIKIGMERGYKGEKLKTFARGLTDETLRALKGNSDVRET